MKFPVNKRTFLTGVAAVTIATTAAITTATATPLFAQEGGAEQAAESTNRAVEIREIRRGPGHSSQEWSNGYIGEDQLLANALDLSEEELQSAYEKAFEIALAQAVTDGELTQAQADELMAVEDGQFMLEGLATNDEITQYLAQSLELSQEEFDAAMDEAIQKAADDGLITQAQANEMLLEKLIEENVTEAYGQALDEGVNQGLITQSQADRMRDEPLGSFGHQEEVIIMEPFGPGDGRFGFGPGETSEECFTFGGPGNMHEECFSFGDSSEFEHDFGRHFEDFGSFGGPGHFSGGMFRMPGFNPFR